jgi:hypothetical protein
MSILRAVPVSWAAVQEPNVQFQPTWEVQVTLTKEQAEELVAEAKRSHPKGIKIAKDDNGVLTYRFKRRVERADGKGNNQPPVVYGPQGKEGGPFLEKIGNGSICNIQYIFTPYDNKFGKGTTSDFKGIQVLEHVKYGIGDGDEFENESDQTSAKQEEATASNDYDEEDFA